MEIQAIREFALEFKHLGATSIGWGYDYLEGVKVLASKWTYPVPYYITSKVIENMMDRQRNIVADGMETDDDFSPHVYEYGCNLLQQELSAEIRTIGQRIADRHQLRFVVVTTGTLDDQYAQVRVAFYESGDVKNENGLAG